MKKLWIGALVAVAVGCTAKYARSHSELKVELTPERVKRGEYLVKTLGACGMCHDGRDSGDLAHPADPDLHLAGGNFLRDGAIGVWVPNITNDPETGIVAWTDAEIIRAIREGVRPDGTALVPLMPYTSYQNLSDEDAMAIVAYLRSAPAVKLARPKQPHELPPPLADAIQKGLTLPKPVGRVPAPDRADPVKYGEYLTHVSHCGECHAMGGHGRRPMNDRWMAGGDIPMELPGVGKVWASNLTPHESTGLGRYSAAQIKNALVSGQRLDGKLMAPPMSMLMPHLALAEPADIDAIVAYLQSLPPVENAVRPRELTPDFKKLLGED